MYLEDSIYIIIDLLKQKQEQRAFFTYTINSLFMQENNKIEYVDYLKQLGLIQENNSNCNIKEIRQQAEITQQDIKNQKWK